MPVRLKNKDGDVRLNVDVRYVEGANSVLFDVFTNDVTSCNNITVESARELREKLNNILAQADAAPKVEQTVHVSYDSVHYYLPADSLVDRAGYSSNQAYINELIRHAELVVNAAGKVLKSRHTKTYDSAIW